MPKLATKTVEKSKLSESFFCMSAVFKPLWTKTVAILIKMVINATRPKSLGARTLARTIESAN